MRSVTLAQLRSRVKELADIENSSFVTDLDALINQAFADFYDRVTAGAWGEDYWSKEKEYAIVAGTKSYALEADFYKLRGVDWKESATQRTELLPWEWNERTRYYSQSASVALPYQSMRYRIRGRDPAEGAKSAYLEFLPVPTGAGTVVVTYIPTPPTLSDGVGGVTTFDDVCGWSEYVVLRAVEKIKLKEGDPGLAETRALADVELQRILSSAPIRDVGRPKRIADTRRRYLVPPSL